ncbi:cobalt-precorrin-5B (C(1))-methyltransferase CbiD [Euhalothece natronophila]|nr:cobalt-precorrin-5B (C(1))-methyltransferase CbiD [Euhalothece natronophila]
MSEARSGYTLPVFACASAVAALNYLQDKQPLEAVEIDLIKPPQQVSIPIEQIALLEENKALAITRSDPGDNLDLTANTPIWAVVSLQEKPPVEEAIIIQGGEGVGKQLNRDGKAAIYRYAKELLQGNLQPLLHPNQQVTVTIILPEGKQLAQRTSNAAFGVVEGLSLLGTTGISQPLTAPGQLTEFQEELAQKAQQFDTLVFCVGENGLDLARKQGFNPEQLVKTANWMGPLLVAAGEQGVQSLVLFGYHGKLIKLAGAIFHTHHHLADARLEILTAMGAKVGLSTDLLQKLLASETTEAALKLLREQENGGEMVERIYSAIARSIDQRAQDYIRKHAEKTVQVGSVLFDGKRNILTVSPLVKQLFPDFEM